MKTDCWQFGLCRFMSNCETYNFVIEKSSSDIYLCCFAFTLLTNVNENIRNIHVRTISPYQWKPYNIYRYQSSAKIKTFLGKLNSYVGFIKKFYIHIIDISGTRCIPKVSWGFFVTLTHLLPPQKSVTSEMFSSIFQDWPR